MHSDSPTEGDESLMEDDGGVFVKICGVTTVADALHAVQAGAGAIGLNFHPASPRCVSRETAREIVDAVDIDGIFGVFVNQSVDEIKRIVDATGISIIQLHGDQSPEFTASLQPHLVFRAFRFRGDSSFPEIEQYLDDCDRLGAFPSGILIDAYDSTAVGGTGKVVDWTQLFGQIPDGLAWLLAGGLTPENVGEAIRICRPWGVDVASGVESSPGVKDPAKVEAFLRTVVEADQRIGGA